MRGVGPRTVMCAWQYQAEPAACITEMFSGNAWLPMDRTFGFRDQGSDIVKVSQGVWCWGEDRTEPGMAMDVNAVPIVGQDLGQARCINLELGLGPWSSAASERGGTDTRDIVPESN